jgi:hypothetical protein
MLGVQDVFASADKIGDRDLPYDTRRGNQRDTRA